MVVAKYGGTSMANPEIVAEIVQSNQYQKIIVCSAPGKSISEKRKATDMLLDLCKLKEKNEPTELKINELIKRFEKIVLDLPMTFQKRYFAKLRSDLETHSDHNFLISRGEYYSAWAFSERIKSDFIDAKDLFYFKNDGTLDRKKSVDQIRSKLSKVSRVVVPGFYGANPDGKIVLFGRGGSDRSGAILAASLNADYENWTDVNGIMSGDPKIVDNPQVLGELTYEEVREGAHGGTGVLMGDSILDIEYGNGDVILRNTFKPEARGTRIKKSRKFDESQPVIALSARDDLFALTIHDLGMRDSKGYLAKILEILAQNNISIEHMPTAQDSITITFHNKRNINLENLKQKFKAISVSPSASCGISECGVVYLVGESLRRPSSQHHVMISSLQLLETHGIAVWAIVAHPDSPSIATIIKRDHITKAQKILHSSLIS